MLTTSLLVALGLGFLSITMFTIGLRWSGPEAAKHRRTDATVQPVNWLHNAPAEPPSPSEAHRDMQLHLGCNTEECGRKAAAFDALVSAGVIKTSRAR